MKNLVLLSSLSACILSANVYMAHAENTGSNSPQLTVAHASHYSMISVLEKTGTAGAETSDPWDPTKDSFMDGKTKVTPDYTVNPSLKEESATGFKTIQGAVNRACLDAQKNGNSKKRIYIAVNPGVYNEIVYVPETNNTSSSDPNSDEKPFTVPPITIYGTGARNTDTKISMNLDANLPGNPAAKGAAEAKRNFADTVNPGSAVFTSSNTTTFSGIWKMYSANASKKGNIGTGSTCVVWVKNGGFQMKNLTIENSYNENYNSKTYYTVNKQQPSGNHQAVALETDGTTGKFQFENIRLIGNQDTLYIKASAVFTTIRNYFRNCYVEGDVDFIFGRATAYFYKCEIRTLGERNTSDAFCTASSANLNTSYGFVFDDCDFTNDGKGICAPGKTGAFLGRQWFESISQSPYNAKDVVIGTNNSPNDTRDKTHCPRFVYEAVGKTVVMNSRIGKHIDPRKPWADWADSGSAFRVVQYDSDEYWKNLSAALEANKAANGSTTMETLYPKGKKRPVDLFYAEYKNTSK